MKNPLNYIEPDEPDYFCTKASSTKVPEAPNYCIFPQDIRSLSYWGKAFILVPKGHFLSNHSCSPN